MGTRRVGIIQARMGSTRLPGKVLMDLAGAPMLAQQLRRLKRCGSLDELLVATTDSSIDDPIVSLAKNEGVSVFRGSEHDVLARYAGAAAQAGADVVARLTADCPLIDPQVCAKVVDALPGFDYASNVLERTYPRGLDCEAMTRAALERSEKLAQSPPAREHVTRFILVEQPELFKTRSVRDEADNSDLRWTVDTPEDLALARAIYAGLDLARAPRPYPEILAYVRSRPELLALNAQIRQKAE